MSNYSERLKDPRWQKMRLRVLDRDNWTCQICGDKESTLHVHHRVYEAVKDPWDCSLKRVVVLCEECHSNEKGQIKYACDLLIKTVKKKFFSSEILDIAEAFEWLSERPPHDMVTFAASLRWGFKRENIIQYLISKFVSRNRKKDK